MKERLALRLCSSLVPVLVISGCGAKARPKPIDGAPPPPVVQKESNGDDPFQLERPDLFPLVTATKHSEPVEITVDGSVVCGASLHTTGLPALGGPFAKLHSEPDRRYDSSNLKAAGFLNVLSEFQQGYQMAAEQCPESRGRRSPLCVICTVFENEMRLVRIGERVRIRVDSYSAQFVEGCVTQINHVHDDLVPAARVRLRLANTGALRPGTPVTATFAGREQVALAGVPVSAILHLYGRDCVYVPVQDRRFKRTEVSVGKILPGNIQEVLGIEPGQRVVQDAQAIEAALDSTVH